MNTPTLPIIFGEVLFDCFPTGDQVLGGAPFNVAWHLQALGDDPLFISRIGNDEKGEQIVNAMTEWGMARLALQTDSIHPTGQVQVNFVDGEPSYSITPNCAYDFIDQTALDSIPPAGILYHGSLGLRNDVSRDTLSSLLENTNCSVFLDVNLRPPWFSKQDVVEQLRHAYWVKLNEHELRQLGFTAPTLEQAMEAMQSDFPVQHLIVTRGEQGAIVRTRQGALHTVAPQSATQIVDTVGAGDAFCAMYIHGLIHQWPISEILNKAQQFASQVVSIRGATPNQLSFYQDFINLRH
jgi:fructokinase